jgi:hypothetical protein
VLYQLTKNGFDSSRKKKRGYRMDIDVDISRSVLKRGEIQTFTLALHGAVLGDNIYIH